jgi:hypothetical protein
MTTITNIPRIRWGANITPWTCDIDAHREIGLIDFRSNWCRFNPKSWEERFPGYEARDWKLKDHAEFVKEIIGHRRERCIFGVQQGHSDARQAKD